MLEGSLEKPSSLLKWPLVVALAVPFAELFAQVVWHEEWQKAILVLPLVGAVLCLAVFDLIGQEIADRLRTRVSVRNLLLFVLSWTLVGGYGMMVGLFRGNNGFYVGADVYHWFIEILGVAIIFVWASYRYRSSTIAAHLLAGFLLFGLIGISVVLLGMAGFAVAGGNAVAGSSLWRLDLGRGFPLVPLMFALAIYVHPPRTNSPQHKTLAQVAIAVLLLVLFFTLKRTQWALFPIGVLGIVLSKRLLAWSMVILPCVATLYWAIDYASPGTTTRWIDAASDLVTYNRNWTVKDTLDVREEQTQDAVRQAFRRWLGEGFGGELRTINAEGTQNVIVHYVHSLHAYYLLQLGPAGYAVMAVLTGGLLLAVFRAMEQDPNKEWMARASFVSICALLASGLSMVSIHTCFAGMVAAVALMALQPDDLVGGKPDEDDDDEEEEEEEDDDDFDDEDEDEDEDDFDDEDEYEEDDNEDEED